MAGNEDRREADGEAEAPARTGRMKPLLIGLALMAMGAGGGYAAVTMGLIPGFGGGGDGAPEAMAEAESPGPAEAHGDPRQAAATVAFVPVEPMVVTLGSGMERTHLRFASQLEVPAGRATEVAALMPRVVDVLGGYLRALDPAAVAERDAGARLRSQMLRRAQLVLGPEAVNDLLVTEFVLN